MGAFNTWPRAERVDTMVWEPVQLTPFIPMLGLLLVFALNQAVLSRRSSHLTDRDIRGLRAALLSELVLLRSLIADNLALITHGEEYLLSFRVLTQVYRSNAGRLNLLAEMEIEAVVSAYGETEAAEVFIGAVTKAHGTHAYRIWLGGGAWNDVGRRLASAQSAVDVAILRLDPAGRRGLVGRTAKANTQTSRVIT
jgi:hypothetical protein